MMAADQAVLEVTYRLPAEIVQQVEDSALARHEDPDAVVAEALRFSLPPSRARISRDVKQSIDRLNALNDDDLSDIAQEALSKGESDRLELLLNANRSRKLTEVESNELARLQGKLVDLSADRVLAQKLLHDRKFTRAK